MIPMFPMIRRAGISLLLIATVIVLIPSGVLQAQISDKITRVTVSPVSAGQPATIRVELVQPDRIDRIEIAYRAYGTIDFRRTETSLTGNIATATIPGITTAATPTLEYYVILYLRGALKPETYPVENPEQQPLQISLAPPEPAPASVTILSPDENETLAPEDALISFFVDDPDSAFALGSTKIILDGIDYSGLAVRTGNLFVLKPENAVGRITAGAHSVTVELADSLGKTVKRVSWPFTVSGGTTRGAVAPGRTPEEWSYSGSAQLETRNENVASSSTSFNRASLAASGRYLQYRVDGRMYLTNEEQDDRQPQNRYYIGASAPWFNLSYGDVFTEFPSLIMNGKRVRGVSGSLTLPTFSIDIVQGSITRNIQTVFSSTGDSAAVASRNPGGMIGMIDTVSKLFGAVRQFGTFDRNILIVHPIFGARDGNHLGFTYLKSTDDINSIQRLINPRYGPAPEENLVVGSDMHLTFDRRNIEIHGEAAFSATNTDISVPTFTDADIDRIFPESSYSESNRNNIRTIRDLASHFITVNQYLIPLGTQHMPTLSYNAGMSLNYFGNFLKADYLRHGESYESFGQSYLRTDVQGYSIADRLRLSGNKLFLSAGFEQLEDNTAETKLYTTTYTTLNTSVSYYSVSDFPTTTVGYLLASNDNGKPEADSLAVNDRTNRIFLSLSKPFRYMIEHQAGLNVSTSFRNDNTFHKRDTRNTNVTMNLTSTFRIPLQTTLALVITSSRYAPQDSSPMVSVGYTTLVAGAQYRLLEDKLRCSGIVSPTFGDLSRILVDASVQYYFVPEVSLQSQLSLYLNQSVPGINSTNNDVVWSLILRADI